MFKNITAKIERVRNYPQSKFDIDTLTQELEGRLYDHLKYDFHQEKIVDIGEYIPCATVAPVCAPPSARWWWMMWCRCGFPRQ